ncbi:MAG: hypothetical protein WD079_04440 [Phycisphaeraceae bacterium]
MDISLRKAKPLCTATEFELVEESFQGENELKPAGIRHRITRARKLRNKYRDLAERQRREARGKQEPHGTRPSQSNDRTVLKQQLFEQTMQRFQGMLSEMEPADTEEASDTEAAHEPATRSTKPAQEGGPVGHARKRSQQIIGEKRVHAAEAGRAGKLTDNAGQISHNDPIAPRSLGRRTLSFVSKLTRKRSHFAESARQHIVGHVATLTRQNQARRDGRN